MSTNQALIASSMVQGFGQLAGGFSANRAAGQEAAAQMEQANIIAREASVRARQKASGVGKFQQRQAHAYLKSGVRLEGTPIQVLEETRRKGIEEVNAIVSQGEAQVGLAAQRAQMTKRAGRSAAMQALFRTAGTGLSSYLSYQRFNSPLYANPATPMGPFPAGQSPLPGVY